MLMDTSVLIWILLTQRIAGLLCGEDRTYCIGSDDFQKFQKENAPTVDKTLFIKELMEDGNDHILITRPRRYGKSYAASMLRYFLDIRGNSTEIFKGTLIAEKKKFRQRYQNKYPVIHFVFPSGFSSYDAFIVKMKNKITWLYQNHEYLVEDPRYGMTEAQKRRFRNVADGTWSKDELDGSLAILAKYLTTAHGEYPIFILDEYDSPIVEALNLGIYDVMIAFMRGFLQESLKFNEKVKKSVIFGVSQVSKEGLFSGLNHFQPYSIAKNKYAQYFGFTIDEADKLRKSWGGLKHLSIKSLIGKYNGYQIGNWTLLNPWSVVKCFSQGGRLGNYWTESGGTIDNFMKLCHPMGPVVLLEMQILLAYQSIIHHFDEKLTFPKVKEDLDSFWTLATQLGYLTFDPSHMDLSAMADMDFECRLKIPNAEVRRLFLKTFSNLFAVYKGLASYSEWADAFQAKNVSLLQNYYQRIFDFSKKNILAAGNTENVEKRIIQLFSATLQSLRKYNRDVDVSTVGNKVHVKIRNDGLEFTEMTFEVERKSRVVSFFANFFKTASANVKAIEVRFGLKDIIAIKVSFAERKEKGKS